MRSNHPPIVPAALAAIGLLALCLTSAHAGVTTRVSVGRILASDVSSSPSISADGRCVAFNSWASNLVPGDTNGAGDIFVHDRETGETTRVSVASDGTEGDNTSDWPSISADGRCVAFNSGASNLVHEDTNVSTDVFLHDRETGETTRVSVASDGTQGDGYSDDPSISADGRYVAFDSDASNLVDGDTNGHWDVFVHDRQTGETTRVSVAGDGSQGDSYSALPSISGDGRYVAFFSNATNLVDGDTNGLWDVFVHDRQTGATTLVSVAGDGSQGDDESGSPSISADGRYVAFDSKATNLVDGDTNGLWDVFVHDRETGATTLVSVAGDGSQGDKYSASPSISGDGRYVAFWSSSSNLVPGDTNNEADIFVHDRDTGETTRVSLATDGSQGDDESGSPSISADGRCVAFNSWASNLVDGDTNGVGDIFVRDRQTGQTALVSVPTIQGDGSSEEAAISGDGRHVAFTSAADNLVAGDTNGVADIFVHDRWTRENSLVSVATGGAQANSASRNCSVSGDGRYVAFDCQASNLVSGDDNWAYDVFVHDRETGETTRVSVASDGSQANSHNSDASISADGRYVAFGSWASNLVDDDTNGYRDVFVHDRVTSETTLVSVASDGSQGDQDSYYPAISADGRYVAFESSASNLVDDDTNGWADVFVHDRETGETTRVSVASDGSQGNGYSDNSAISADGRYVAFRSPASNLVAGDTNLCVDIFVHDRQTGETTRVSVGTDGTQGNGGSTNPSVSADGRYVAFHSGATDLVPGDTNAVCDIFVHDRDTGETTRVSVATDGTEGNGDSVSASISADGRCVAFASDADNLVPGDTNGFSDVFVHARWAGVVCCFSYDPAAPDDQTPVQFTDCSTHPYAQVVAWEWDFGDGGTSTEQNPSHEFAGGTYLVSLTVSDNYGGATSCEQQIVVLASTVQVSIPLSEGWHMISLPLEPVNKTILVDRASGVEDAGSIFYSAWQQGSDPRMRLFRMEPAVGYWVYNPDLYPDESWYEVGVEPPAGKPSPGPWWQGFWLLVEVPEGITLSYEAYPMPEGSMPRFLDLNENYPAGTYTWAWMLMGACARVPEPYDPNVTTWPLTNVATDTMWGEGPPEPPLDWLPTCMCEGPDAWDEGCIGVPLVGFTPGVGYYSVSPLRGEPYCGPAADTNCLAPGEGYWLDVEHPQAWLSLLADQWP